MKKRFKILCALSIVLATFTNTFHTSAEPPNYTADDTAVDCQHQEKIHKAFLEDPGKTSNNEITFTPNPREQYTTYHSCAHTCKHKIHSDFLRKNSLTLWELLFDNVNKKTVDDTDLDLYNQDKLGQKFLESLETSSSSNKPTSYNPSPALIDAYKSYKNPSQCDLINACLRGDLFVDPVGGDVTLSPSRPFQPPSFGTNLHVSVNVAVDIMEKALELKNYLCNHQLPPHNLMVYRGVCQPKVLHSVANNNINNLAIITESLKRVNTSEEPTVESFLGKNIIYQAKDISSTSKSLQTAKRYADRHRINGGPLPIIMQIDIQPGTACGETYDDLDQEVTLQPHQQIQINSAERRGAYIILHCQTIPTETKK